MRGERTASKDAIAQWTGPAIQVRRRYRRQVVSWIPVQLQRDAANHARQGKGTPSDRLYSEGTSSTKDETADLVELVRGGTRSRRPAARSAVLVSALVESISLVEGEELYTGWKKARIRGDMARHRVKRGSRGRLRR